jgi:hypothetical protein
MKKYILSILIATIALNVASQVKTRKTNALIID